MADKARFISANYQDGAFYAAFDGGKKGYIEG